MGSVDRLGSNFVIKPISMVRLTIGEENDDLLHVSAAVAVEYILCLPQALFSICGAARAETIDGVLVLLNVLVGYIAQLLTRIRSARKLHDCKARLLILLKPTIVLGRRIDKAIGSVLEIGHLAAAHGTRGIEHQHNIERLAGFDHLFEVRGRRKRGQTHKEVGVALFHLLAVQPGIVIVSERVIPVEHALIGPDATNVLRRRLAARTRVLRPNVRRIRVNYRCARNACGAGNVSKGDDRYRNQRYCHGNRGNKRFGTPPPRS